MADKKYASFDPDSMKESAGLFDNVDATVKNFQFTTEPPSESYGSDGSPLFAVLTLVLNGAGSEQDRTVSQSYSLGATAGANYEVSEDGYKLVAIVDEPVLRGGTKFGTLMKSMKAAGVSAAVINGGDLSKFIGINGHWKRVADEERNFRNANAKAKKFPPSTLVLAKLHSAAAGAKTAAATTGSDVDEQAAQYLIDVLQKGAIQRGRLVLAVSKAAAAEGNRQAIAKRAAEESFLATLVEQGVITYDGSEKGQPVALA